MHIKDDQPEASEPLSTHLEAGKERRTKAKKSLLPGFARLSYSRAVRTSKPREANWRRRESPSKAASAATSAMDMRTMGTCRKRKAVQKR